MILSPFLRETTHADKNPFENGVLFKENICFQSGQSSNLFLLQEAPPTPPDPPPPSYTTPN